MTDMQLLEEISRTGDAFLKALYAAKDAGFKMSNSFVYEMPRYDEQNRFVRPCSNCNQTDITWGCYRDDNGSIVWQLKCQSCQEKMAYGGTILDCVHEWNGEHNRIKEK